ncbi:MAG TPA: VWA domain-containing protein [Terriglobia bacterium]|nr:VWA domain-containing protein [Terriglobia bacterium]
MAAVLGLAGASIAASAGLPRRAQEPPVAPAVPVPANEPGFKLRVQQNVVIVRVAVRDSNGRAVTGLGKDDFKISDNRKPQEVSGFSVEAARAAVASRQPPASDAAAGAVPAPKVSGESTAPGEPLTFSAFYFDDLNTAFASVVRSRDAAGKFIDSAPATERFAIFTSSGAQDFDFTADRQKLRAVLLKLHSNPRLQTRADCPEITDYLASQIVNQEDPDAYRIVRDEAINECHEDPRSVTDAILRMQAQAVYSNYVIQARANLANLDGVIGRVALMPGERRIVLVSDGFMPLEMRDRVERVIDHALRERVIISALDAKGLAVMLREGDASRSYMPGGDLAALSQTYDASRESAATAPLAEIADGTGGQFFHNNNDLLAGFRKILAPPEVSYVLTFSPSKLKNDGAFHTLKVSLVNGHGMTVEARKGYFAPKTQVTPEEQAKDQIRQAAFSRETIQDLPLSVQTHVTQTGTQGEKIDVDANLDVRSLPFRTEGDRSLDDVTFTVALFDQDGKLVTASQGNRALALKSGTLAKLQKSGLDFAAHVTVKPGTYTVRVVVRETQGGEIAALSRTVEP